jgi:DNA replication protein DnaC
MRKAERLDQQWAEALDDEVLVTALLDRLLFHRQVIKLQGSSYRMENRREIFES